MSEKQNCSARDFSKYDTMETQELEAILRQDAEATNEQESDTEKILYIADVLASRENAKSTGNSAQIAWESFEKNYLPMEDDSVEHTTKRKPVPSWVRRLTAAAAVLVLLIGLSATAANAFGWEDIWNAVAKWAKETFSFVSDGETLSTEPSEADSLQFASLQQALAETNGPADLVPTWIPERYMLRDITVDENPMQRMYIAFYKDGENSLKITVQTYLLESPEKIEIQETPLEVYKVSGAEYYIIENDSQLRAAWIKDSHECYISGELTIEEIKTMIDSIGKG